MEANCRHKEGANWPNLFINNNHTICNTCARLNLGRRYKEQLE